VIRPLSSSLRLCGLAAILLSCGGGPSPYDRTYAEAARAESAGRLAEAADDYERAATQAARPRDCDRARWAAIDVMVHAGRVADAVARLDALAQDATSIYQAEAAYRAAELRIEHGDPERGWRDMEQIPRRFPTHGVAHVAVRRLVAHADEKGASAALEELHALEHDLARTELVELVAFLSGEHLEALGDEEAARDAYLRIVDRWPYPYGAFFDDALWHASLLDEKLGRAQAAADDLERLVAVRETTTIMGSYEKARYVPAMLRLAELYDTKLHDRARARATYHRLYTDFAHSTKRDEALWREAALWREDGDARTACDRLATLVHEFPDSRYVPCATAACPGLARPDKSGAPASCHAYVTRAEAGAPKTD